MLTDEKMRLALLMHIRKVYGSQKGAADAWGFSEVHVSNMVTGRKLITESVLSEMGYERDVEKLVTYRKIKSPE